MTNFIEKFKKESEEMPQQSGGWFKFKEGKNKVRILVEPVLFFEKFKRGIYYTDCGFTGTPKYLTFIFDYADNKRKLAKFPFQMMNTIVELMASDDYKAETFPLPYDITITAENAGTKEVKYTVLPARNNSEVQAEALDGIEKENTPTEIIEKMKEKQIEKDKASGEYKTKEEREAEKKVSAIDPETVEYADDELPDPKDIPF